jgi:dimethylaniline monooxygenase (N-oxide forming)
MMMKKDMMHEPPIALPIPKEYERSYKWIAKFIFPTGIMLAILVFLVYAHFLPIWWACSVAASVVTTIFGEIFGTHGTIAWTIFVAGAAHWTFTNWKDSWEYTAKVTRLANKPTGPKKKVGVVGAGLSGIAAAKELIQDGHEVEVFEKYSDFGGIWNAAMKFGVWDHTLSTSSRLHTMFSDLPIPPRDDALFHIPQKVYMEYLREYANHFGVTPRITFSAKVVKVSPLPGDRWEIEVEVTKTGADGSTMVETIKRDYDYVAVASGTHAQPVTPTVPGLETFTGRQAHSIYYHDASSFVGRRVLAVGLGESSSDIVAEIAKVATKTVLSVRNPTLVLPRSFHDRPPDYNDGHNLQSLTPWMRMGYIGLRLNITLAWIPWLYGSKYNPAEHHHRKWHLKLFRAFDLLKGFPKIMSPYLITKTSYIIGELESGRVQLKRGVNRIDGAKVYFEDGSWEEVDDIVWFTGLKPNYTFLPKFQDQMNTDRYLLTLHPELPNMGFIGYVRPHIGNIPINAEMQSRFFAAIVSDRLLEPLPSKEKQVEFINYIKAHNGCRFAIRVSANLFNNLATRFIGCAPNWFDIFLRDPEVWWKLRNSTYVPSMYRLQGPHAFKGDEVYQLMRNEPENAIPGHKINDAVIFVLNQFVAFYAQLPYLKDIHYIQPQCTLYF